MEQLTIATLNIAAASKERARRIIDEWIAPSSYDIYVLTETSEGAGTQLIVSEMKNAGWSVFQRPTLPKDRGVVVLSKITATSTTAYPANDPAPGRTLIVELDTAPSIQLVGMYVPNRGNDFEKTERKRLFLNCWLRHLVTSATPCEHRILLGDLNVVPTTQHPQFLPQEQFEYEWYRQLAVRCRLHDAAVRYTSAGHESTWVAHTGEGYTYDHIMPAESLSGRVVKFAYDHSTRARDGLTDHSALIIWIALDSIKRLDLASRAVPTKQATLF